MRSRHHSILLTFVTAATVVSLAGCSSDTLTQPGRKLRPSVGPSAAKIYNDVNVPLAGTIFNPCTGEFFVFSGSGHFRLNLTFDAGGGIHVTQHFNAQGITGTGTITGITYTGNEADNDSFNAKYGEEETITQSFGAISHGPAPNYRVHFLEHITVNANGDVTVFFTDLSIDCRG